VSGIPLVHVSEGMLKRLISTSTFSVVFCSVKYGEHILNDLGCAFENISPFGFNADGCGSGGAGQVCCKYQYSDYIHRLV
jgi:hypothetical protein